MDAKISQCITSVKRLRKDEVGGCIVQRAQPMYRSTPMRARARRDVSRTVTMVYHNVI